MARESEDLSWPAFPVNVPVAGRGIAPRFCGIIQGPRIRVQSFATRQGEGRMTGTILLIRHGESALGAERRYTGHSSTPLTPRGRRQVTRLRRHLAGFKRIRAVSSDLERCRETARILFPDRPVRFLKGLRELDFGAWEGLTYDEIARRFRDRFDRWVEDPFRAAPPRGETLRTLQRRIRDCVRRLLLRHSRDARPEETLIIVTHGGPIRALLTSTASEFRAMKVPCASMIEYREPIERRSSRRASRRGRAAS